MDIASFAFSAASLISLFNVCVQGYTAIRTAKNLGKDATRLLCQIEIEEARFITWGRTVGLLPQADNGNELKLGLEHATTVIRILVQISDIFSSTKVLRDRYGIIVEDQESSGNATTLVGTTRVDYIDGLQSIREQFVEEYKRQSAFAPSLQRGNSLLKKIRWVFTDKETLATLISTLRDFNNSLESMLNSTSRRQFQQDFQVLCLESMKTNDLLKLQILEGAARDQYNQLALPASHKVLRLRLELEFAERFDNRTPDQWPGTEIASLQIPKQKVYIEDNSASRSFGLYESKQVLVEWRDLESGIVRVVDTRILQRLQHISKLLHTDSPKPPEFRSLSCSGFLLLESPARFAFVYNLPKPLSPSTDRDSMVPESLHDVLSDENRERYRPSQTARFILAKRLATSLLYLHTTGWLHKGIRSQNILVLGEGNRSSALSISKLVEEPYLVGHGYARLSSNVSGTEPVYNDPLKTYHHHPDILGENRARFQKKYDVYSLGVVLVEIAYWKPLGKLVSSRRTATENSKKLIELATSGDLAHWMGSIYSEAVRICLSCEWSSEDLELEFFDKVVKQLDQCLV